MLFYFFFFLQHSPFFISPSSPFLFWLFQPSLFLSLLPSSVALSSISPLSILFSCLFSSLLFSSLLFCSVLFPSLLLNAVQNLYKNYFLKGFNEISLNVVASSPVFSSSTTHLSNQWVLWAILTVAISDFIIWLSLFLGHDAHWLLAETSRKKRIALPGLCEGNILFYGPVSFGGKISKLI